MLVSTTGEGVMDQVAAARRNHERNNASAFSNLPSTIADYSGGVGPLIICLSDDDDNEEENRIVQTGSISEPDSSVRTLAKPANSGDDTQRWSSTPVLTFTVQCNACGKWRLMPSKEQYHTISEQMRERPWVCEEAQAWRENASCQDPTDLSENESDILWAVDETIIPKPPPGFFRKVVVRGERSQRFADVYYLTPCGRKLRSTPDVERFLDKLPRHKREEVTLSQFSFTAPKPGRNLHKRAFKKVGKIWKRIGSELRDPERKFSQPAILDGARSSIRPSEYPNPQPLAVLDPTGSQMALIWHIEHYSMNGTLENLDFDFLVRNRSTKLVGDKIVQLAAATSGLPSLTRTKSMCKLSDVKFNAPPGIPTRCSHSLSDSVLIPESDFDSYLRKARMELCARSRRTTSSRRLGSLAEREKRGLVAVCAVRAELNSDEQLDAPNLVGQLPNLARGGANPTLRGIGISSTNMGGEQEHVWAAN